MSKTDYIRARVEPELKHDVESIFHELGMSTTEAITLFYKQVKVTGGLPFKVKVPNAITKQAIAEARNRKGMKHFENIEELYKGLAK